MRKRFTEEQIIRILKQGESGEKVRAIVREHGICEQTYYKWKSKYSGMEIQDMRRLKDLEAENKLLKRLVAEKELHILGLKTALGKKY